MLKGFWPRLALGAAGLAVLMVGAAIWIPSGGKHAEVQLAKSEGLRSTSTGIALEKKALTDAPTVAQDFSRAATNSIILAQASEVDARTVPPPASPVARFEMIQDFQPGATESKGKDAAAPILAANAPSRELQEAARAENARRAAAREWAEAMARRDDLTGLRNDRFFHARLHRGFLGGWGHRRCRSFCSSAALCRLKPYSCT